jgi:hypothetical protein
MTTCAIARWWGIGALLAILSGCAAVNPGAAQPADAAYAADRAAAAMAPPDLASSDQAGMNGVWEGTSVADCAAVFQREPGRCASMQKITLTMFQQGPDVTGYYKCAFGTQICRNLNENGVIKKGKMTGRRLMMRVMLGDGSMCFFTGISQDGSFNGNYMCLQGAGIVEQGRFNTQRSY